MKDEWVAAIKAGKPEIAYSNFDVASLLTEDDVSLVSAWLASQPMPDDPSPLPARTLSTPMPCGSEPQ